MEGLLEQDEIGKGLASTILDDPIVGTLLAIAWLRTSAFLATGGTFGDVEEKVSQTE